MFNSYMIRFNLIFEPYIILKLSFISSIYFFIFFIYNFNSYVLVLYSILNLYCYSNYLFWLLFNSVFRFFRLSIFYWDLLFYSMDKLNLVSNFKIFIAYVYSSYYNRTFYFIISSFSNINCSPFYINWLFVFIA